MNRRAHWEQVYASKGDAELSWFQARPNVSLALIDSLRPPPQRVIDIGGGQSSLAGELVARGVESVTVLDLSSAALDRARERAGPAAERIKWLVADVLEAEQLGEYALWHDRAVFHFLTDPSDRRKYIAAVSSAVAKGGHLIVATFALTGPEKCSGLPVCRYDGAGLAAEFGDGFQFIDSAPESHTTPWGKSQDFTYLLLRRE